MKKYLFTLISVAVFSTLFCRGTQRSETAGITVIEGATVIDGVSDAPIRDAILVIDGERISRIGRRGSFQPPENAQVIRMPGKTIIPGMFNLHGHVAMIEGMEGKVEYYTRERIQRDANRYLYYGITNALSLGMDMEPMQGFLADQRAGGGKGARLYSAGLGFAAQDGARPAGVVDINRPTSPEEARALVRKEIQKNPDTLKIFPVRLSPDIYGAIIDEAHRHNVRVLAHVHDLEDAKELMRRGVDSLAHSVRDQEVDAEFLKLAKDNDVTQLPTLIWHQGPLAYAEGTPAFLDDPGLHPLFPAHVLTILRSKEYQERLNRPSLAKSRGRRAYETAMKNAAKMAAAGIPLAVGTDSGGWCNIPWCGSGMPAEILQSGIPIGMGPAIFQGLSEHREMEFLVKAGLTPMQAIQAATINGARFLRVEDKYGSLEIGKVADFIVLNADPLSEITNSRKIDAVWMDGKPVDRGALAQQ